ncbi:MAG: aldo/keto reductase [Proteobacteria bacterium]|nr:aldo/keto reductase [Pseudomonadota bacterium]
MTSQPRITLNDGRNIPQIGLGVFKVADDEAAAVVRTALGAGYRHIDTAAIYRNEAGVGEGLRTSGLAREDVFVTTKVWNEDQGFDATLRAADASLKRLGLAYVDLYLVHWPSPHRGLYRETWKALVRLKEEGKVRSIGVSNFGPSHLAEVIDDTGVVPVLNQIELHPAFQQKTLRAAHTKYGIVTESWSPLGQGQILADATLVKIAAKHQRSVAQVIIRWHIQSGFVVIPKSANSQRIAENFDVFGFALDEADMRAIAGMDSADGRIGPDPLTATF